jgi:DNA (cytosine-5)-methyltransferase 1
MRYGSVCSGIEAATAAWHPLGWEPAFFSEIEPFPRAVLAHHYPDVPLHGDFTTIQGDEYGAIDLLVGGTPCQSFSVAGIRTGLDDDRGNLALEFLRLVERTRPKWLVWENVPGVLSSNGGRDFGSILGGMVECGYGFAYRVLDAVHFGTQLMRRRVFVVAFFGDWRSAAAVLFDRAAIADLRKSSTGVPCIDASGLAKKQTMPERGRCWTIHDGNGHRFLTPIEIERLFGFPDDYTKVNYRDKIAYDGPRYRALGNSMAVPVMNWIGRRINEVEKINGEK